MRLFFRAITRRGCWRPSPYSIPHHKDLPFTSSGHFQNIPKNPILFLFRKLGVKDQIQAQVHLSSNIMVNRLWKWEMADRVRPAEPQPQPQPRPLSCPEWMKRLHKLNGALATPVMSPGTWISRNGLTFCFPFAACSWTIHPESSSTKCRQNESIHVIRLFWKNSIMYTRKSITNLADILFLVTACLGRLVKWKILWRLSSQTCVIKKDVFIFIIQ